MSIEGSVLTRFLTVAERPCALTAEQMRELDRHTIEEIGVPGPVLMERAALGVAEFILRRFAGKHTLIFCGRGNNGGDGLAAARHLHLAGHSLVCLVAASDPNELSPDARLNLEAARRVGVDVRLGASVATVGSHLLRETELVVDCLLGTGARGELREPLAGLASIINSLGARGVPVVAVDVPSGVDASDGTIARGTVAATYTVTFHAPKTGLVVPPGSEAAGEVLVWSIGIPSYLDPPADVTVVTETHVAVPGRRPDDHKYKAGYVAVLAGSAEYPGAALLSCQGAVAAGAGYVRLMSDAQVVDALRPALYEVTATALTRGGHLEPSQTVLEAVGDPRISALAVGPGLGRKSETLDAVRAVILDTQAPAVLDADGLLAFKGDPTALARRPALVLTPHAGELAALMSWPVEQVTSCPLRAAREAAAATGQVVLLKGSSTLVAAPSGETWVIVQGPPQLASAGTGDVLTGILAAFLAKGLSPVEAAYSAAWVHAEAGCIAARDRKAGISARDVLKATPEALRGRVYDRRPSWTL